MVRLEPPARARRQTLRSTLSPAARRPLSPEAPHGVVIAHRCAQKENRPDLSIRPAFMSAIVVRSGHVARDELRNHRAADFSREALAVRREE
ncbi:MAG: hypothetical protein ACR652_20800, partial [Methylocystis sp.]|uniref:hypothetical protein n=1 Tax=Methylocystis sp. TaxID=1911079 RepID=UPI003DA38B73